MKQPIFVGTDQNAGIYIVFVLFTLFLCLVSSFNISYFLFSYFMYNLVWISKYPIISLLSKSIV